MKRRFIGPVLAGLLAAACGGSDGDGGSVQVPPPPDTTLAITADNASTAVAAAYAAATQSAETGDLVGGSGIVGSAKPASSSSDGGGLVPFLHGVVAKVPVGPETVPCDVSGTMTVSGDIANPLTLTAGDNFLIEADACDDGTGSVVDGTIDFTVDEFSGDLTTGMYLLTMTVNLTDFQVAAAGEVVTSNGDSTVSIDTRSLPFVAVSVNGNRLTVDSNMRAATLSAYEANQTVDDGAAGSPYTMIASGTLDTTDLAGIVAYSTPVQFEGSGGGYPFTGELLVSGANNASARLIALDDVNVRIEIDTDGDGNVDATVDTSWAEIDS